MRNEQKVQSQSSFQALAIDEKKDTLTVQEIIFMTHNSKMQPICHPRNKMLVNINIWKGKIKVLTSISAGLSSKPKSFLASINLVHCSSIFGLNHLLFTSLNRFNN